MPNNAILAIVGDVTAEEAFAAAKKVFGDWQTRDVPAQTFIGRPDPTRRVIVVNKPDAVQTEVRVGHIGIPRKHPDYMALNLAIRILGGEGSNRLHQVLRTERGLTYGAQANMDTLKESGDFEAETNTRSDATGEVLRLIVDEFWRLQRERVGERELDDAKAYMTGSFPLTIETPDAIAMQVAQRRCSTACRSKSCRRSASGSTRSPSTTSSASRAHYLKPDRLSVVLVGNAAAFAPQLKGVGFRSSRPSISTTSISRRRTFNERRRRRGAGGVASATGRQAAEPSRTARRRPESDCRRAERLVAPDRGLVGAEFGPVSIVRRHKPRRSRRRTARRPGAARSRDCRQGRTRDAAALKTIKATTKATATTPRGPVEVETTTYIEYPNHVRVESSLPQGEQVQVFDGEHGVGRDPRRRPRCPAEARAGDGDRRCGATSSPRCSRRTMERLRARLLPDVRTRLAALHHALELSGNDWIRSCSTSIRRRI